MKRGLRIGLSILLCLSMVPTIFFATPTDTVFAEDTSPVKPSFSKANASSYDNAQTTNIVALTDQNNYVQLSGAGANLSALQTANAVLITGDKGALGSAYGKSIPDPSDDEKWDQIFNYLDWSGYSFIRLGYEHNVIQPALNTFIWDSPDGFPNETKNYKIMLKILDWAQSRNVDVFMQEFGVNTEWNLLPGQDIRYQGPNNYEQWADGFAGLMNQLINVKKYTTIKGINIANEPGGWWSWSGANIHDGYAALSPKLAAFNINLPIVGPDVHSSVNPTNLWTENQSYIDIFDAHNYASMHEDVLGSRPSIVSDTAIPAYWTEFGGGDNSGYDWNIQVARWQLGAYNNGVDGLARWSFLNDNDIDGNFSFLQTFDPHTRTQLSTITRTPNLFYIDGLLSRFVAKGSNVYTTMTDNPYVTPALFKSPNGNYTLIISNENRSNDSVVNYTFQDLNATQTLHRYRITEANKDQENVNVASDQSFDISPGANSFTDTISKNSIYVYTTYNLNMTDPGIVEDGTPISAQHWKLPDPAQPLESNAAIFAADDANITYSAGWSDQIVAGAAMNPVKVTSTIGAFYDFDITGTGFRLYGQQSKALGTASVYIDGAFSGYASNFSPITRNDMMLFDSGTLSDTRHTVRVAYEGDLTATSIGHGGNIKAIGAYSADAEISVPTPGEPLPAPQLPPVENTTTGYNLLEDNGFESGSNTAWKTQVDTSIVGMTKDFPLRWDLDSPYLGSYAMVYSGNSSFNATTSQEISSNVEDGKYTFRAYVRSTGGFDISEVKITSAAGTFTKQLPQTLNWAWAPVTWSDIDISGGSVKVEFRMNNTASSDRWIAIDNVQLFKDGSTPNDLPIDPAITQTDLPPAFFDGANWITQNAAVANMADGSISIDSGTTWYGNGKFKFDKDILKNKEISFMMKDAVLGHLESHKGGWRLEFRTRSNLSNDTNFTNGGFAGYAIMTDSLTQTMTLYKGVGTAMVQLAQAGVPDDYSNTDWNKISLSIADNSSYQSTITVKINDTVVLTGVDNSAGGVPAYQGDGYTRMEFMPDDSNTSHEKMFIKPVAGAPGREPIINPVKLPSDFFTAGSWSVHDSTVQQETDGSVRINPGSNWWGNAKYKFGTDLLANAEVSFMMKDSVLQASNPGGWRMEFRGLTSLDDHTLFTNAGFAGYVLDTDASTQKIAIYKVVAPSTTGIKLAEVPVPSNYSNTDWNKMTLILADNTNTKTTIKVKINDVEIMSAIDDSAGDVPAYQGDQYTRLSFMPDTTDVSFNSIYLKPVAENILPSIPMPADFFEYTKWTAQSATVSNATHGYVTIDPGFNWWGNGKFSFNKDILANSEVSFMMKDDVLAGENKGGWKIEFRGKSSLPDSTNYSNAGFEGYVLLADASVNKIALYKGNSTKLAEADIPVPYMNTDWNKISIAIEDQSATKSTITVKMNDTVLITGVDDSAGGVGAYQGDSYTRMSFMPDDTNVTHHIMYITPFNVGGITSDFVDLSKWSAQNAAIAKNDADGSIEIDPASSWWGNAKMTFADDPFHNSETSFMMKDAVLGGGNSGGWRIEFRGNSSMASWMNYTNSGFEGYVLDSSATGHKIILMKGNSTKLAEAAIPVDYSNTDWNKISIVVMDHSPTKSTITIKMNDKVLFTALDDSAGGNSAYQGSGYTRMAFMPDNTSVTYNKMFLKLPQVADIEPPSAPGNLRVTGKTATTVNLAWDSATDNVAVTSYDVKVNGVAAATVTGTTYGATGLSPSTTYTFTVTAKDAAGLETSVAITVKTDDVPVDPNPPSTGGNHDDDGGTDHDDDADHQKVKESDLKRTNDHDIVIEASPKAKELTIPQSLLAGSDGASITIHHQNIQLTLPSSVVEQLMENVPAQQRQDAVISLKMEAQNEQTCASMIDKKRAGDCYDFQLKVRVNNKETAVSVFKEPLLLKLKYSKDQVNPNLTGLYYYNETKGEWEYVGGRIEGDYVVAEVTHFSRYAVFEYKRSFHDVPQDAWYKNAVDTLVARHIMQGNEEDKFLPLNRLTSSGICIYDRSNAPFVGQREGKEVS